MKTYVGAKVVQAEPMTKRQWLDSPDRPFDNVEDAEGYRVGYDDGYVSWSPKGVFERCYREITEEEKKLVIP